MWPMALLGPLPGVWQLGDAVYRYVAANRVRRGRCTDDVCAPVAPSSALRAARRPKTQDPPYSVSSADQRRGFVRTPRYDSRNAFVIG